MTPGEHARDMMLRLAAVDPQDGDAIVKIVSTAIVAVTLAERERCAKVAENQPLEATPKGIAKAIRQQSVQ